MPEADGIRYLSRQATEQFNYCLFLDRYGVNLTTEPQGTLAELRPVALFIADRYNLVSKL